MSKRGSTSASRRTRSRCKRCTPRAATSIPSTGSIRRRGFWQAGPTRRTLGRWWLLGCTCILGREGRDVQAFGASDGLGQRRRVQRPADMAGIPSLAGNCSAACLWRRYPPLPSTEVATRARRARSALGSCHNGLTWTPTVTNGHQRFRGTAGRQPFSSCSEPDVGKRFRLWSRRSRGGCVGQQTGSNRCS